MVRTRAAAVRSLRELFHHKGFIEIETPMLQTLHGGAAARPFVTHMNALDIDLYLRIAPELFLKRAVVGGLHKVFEINRNFRNEGIDATHSPEFAMLEFYEAYGDYDSVAGSPASWSRPLRVATQGSTTVRLADGSDYDLGGEWAQLSMYPSLSEALGERGQPADTRSSELTSRARPARHRLRPAPGRPRQAGRAAVGAPGGRPSGRRPSCATSRSRRRR